MTKTAKYSFMAGLAIVVLCGCQKTTLNITNNSPGLVCVVLDCEDFPLLTPYNLAPGAVISIPDIKAATIRVRLYVSKSPDAVNQRFTNLAYWDLVQEKIFDMSTPFWIMETRTLPVSVTGDYRLVQTN